MLTHPKKHLGQNFLRDQGILRRILNAVTPKVGDRIVEIGPGRGALTEGLILGASKITAIEVDLDLHDSLLEKFGGDRLQILAQDALKVDYERLSQNLGGPIRLVGNLPYNVGSPIIFSLLPVAHCVVDQTFMLQKEVVDRMVASEGSKVYGRLSVMVQSRYRVKKLFVVQPTAFYPAPRVESAVVGMIPLAQTEIRVQHRGRFESLVTAAFSSRRKMLRNTLSSYLSQLDFTSVGIRETDRPEDVPVEAFIELSNQLRGPLCE